jgi:hypothetical protein
MCKKESYIVGAALVAVVTVVMFIPVMGMAGSLEPSAAPAPTMKTLDEVAPTWSIKLPVAERFVVLADYNNEAVLDRETGLVWEKQPNMTNVDWVYAQAFCLNRIVGNRMGWRMPIAEELTSLIDPSEANPALPSGHPFNISSYAFLSSTTYVAVPDLVTLAVSFGTMPGVTNQSKDGHTPVWCVRGGQGYDAY